MVGIPNEKPKKIMAIIDVILKKKRYPPDINGEEKFVVCTFLSNRVLKVTPDVVLRGMNPQLSGVLVICEKYS